MMKITTTVATACCAVLFLTSSLRAQNIYENTYIWEAGKDHSGWKAMSNFPNGYVIAGNKFFETSNTQIYMTGFNDFSEHLFTTTHTTQQLGFTQLNTFWKSFTNIGNPESPTGFFIAASGTRNGTNQYYTLRTDKSGQMIGERLGPLGSGIQFGGICQAMGGGYIAVGGDNLGNVALARFNAVGELVTSTALSISGFGWTVQPAEGGGYVLGSTFRTATRIDEGFNVDWSTTISLPVSPDGSAYTYSEFEEILPLENASTGFIMTGSVFSNSTSAVYSARVNWNGTVAWSKINHASNTASPGTPVNWTNSPIERFNNGTGLFDILYTWREGPVSTGGTLLYDLMNPATGAHITSGSLLNSIPVQEAFTVKDTVSDRIVIGGTRGGYSAVYSYATCNLPGEPDVTPPVVVCSDDITTGNTPGLCGAIVNFTASAVDNCDEESTVTCSPPSGSVFPVGTTEVTCSSTDSSGNTGTCSFTVTVNDTEPPTIVCPDNITMNNTAGQPGGIAVFGVAAVDNCSSVTTVCTPDSGSLFLAGSTTVTCTAVDTAGNTASCSFTVTVNDIEPPAMTCPPNMTVITANVGDASTIVNYPEPTIANMDPGTTVTCTPPSGSSFPLGTTTVTCVATDSAGNQSSCQFKVFVFDVSLQEDNGGARVLAFNSKTGEYMFCCDGRVFSGVGSVKVKKCQMKLRVKAADHKIKANLNICKNRGKANLKIPGEPKCKINDKNLANNTAPCAPA